MGKRSNFKRRPHDFYATFDHRAVKPLIPHLMCGMRYDEPCAGDGSLIGLLSVYGFECTRALDIVPNSPIVEPGNALDITDCKGQCFITNPPWSRKMLHPLIAHLSDIAPTWFLMSANWMHNKSSNGYRESVRFLDERCTDIISIGRVRWIKGTKDDGKDDCAWYRFDRNKNLSDPIKFFGPSC